MKIRPTAVLIALQIAASFAAAQAQNDHLLCYDLSRDARAVLPSPPELELTPKQIDDFAARTGCRIRPHERPRARELCIPVAKSPSGPPTGPEIDADYVCYRVRCEDAGSGTVTADATDQFGSGTVTVQQQNSRRLCAPVPKPTPTVTPTLTPTPSPTAIPFCGDGFRDDTEDCDGSDATACPGYCTAECTCPIVIYDTQTDIRGFEVGNRATTTSACASVATAFGLTCSGGTAALLAYGVSDDLVSMPANFGFDASRPVVGRNGGALGANWADLFDGSLLASPYATAATDEVNYWTGANPDGTARDTCNGWTNPAAVGTAGCAWYDCAGTGPEWLFKYTFSCNAQFRNYMCVCF